MSCVLRGAGGVMRQSLNWNIFSFGLKLCQWVPGPWHEWYWNSNGSPTGGLFTWSYTFGPLNRVFFFLNHYFFLATTVSVWSRLIRTTGIRWLHVSQCWNTSGSGGQWCLSALSRLLCWGFISLRKRCRYKPQQLLFSANQPHKPWISSVSEDTTQGRLKSQIGSSFSEIRGAACFGFLFFTSKPLISSSKWLWCFCEVPLVIILVWI